MQYVVKRDGREVVFNKDKISNAIGKASKEVSKILSDNEIINITEKVCGEIAKSEKVTVDCRHKCNCCGIHAHEIGKGLC